tara:strand:- start:1102 stop:1809 length:708 start_codon:yes stop_codon:yes gene_type:complete
LTYKKKALIISTNKLSGDQQMSIDLELLEKTISDRNILFTLRFYLWEGNWISIGYHQKNYPDHWKDLREQGLINIVRRPSGGGAVLHSGGITYALTFNKPEYKKFSYQFVNSWLIKSFAFLGITLKNGSVKKGGIMENCFSTNYVSDLLDENGNKMIGSAQHWKKSSFLQHGEIQVNPPLDLWIKVFGKEPPRPLKIELSKKEIIEHLKICFLEEYSDSSIENIFLKPKDIKNIL